MQVVLALLVIVVVLVAAWWGGTAWRRASTRAPHRGVAFCETCGVRQAHDAATCSACGSPLYVSHLAGRRGA